MQCGQSKGDDLAVGAIGVEVRALSFMGIPKLSEKPGQGWC